MPESKQETQSKNGTKRQASEDAPSPPKRQKQTSQNGKPTKHDRKSQGSDDETDQKSSKASSRRKSSTVDDLDKEMGEESPQLKKQKDGNKGAAPKAQKKSPSIDEGDDSGDDAMSSIKVELSNPAVDEEEDYSDVIDEAPKPKGKKKERKDSSAKPSKPKVKKTTESTPDDPNEAEIKRLQSQLVKCGIRKLWHNELKKYGDDARAKIRHLKKMLADIGMDGRFSEAKAREIRETRELLAEAEAAQEMNALWGMDAGGRASRSKNKSLKLEESEGSEVEDAGQDKAGEDDDDDDEATSFAARRRRAQADLAFLGDDSESD